MYNLLISLLPLFLILIALILLLSLSIEILQQNSFTSRKDFVRKSRLNGFTRFLRSNPLTGLTIAKLSNYYHKKAYLPLKVSDVLACLTPFFVVPFGIFLWNTASRYLFVWYTKLLGGIFCFVYPVMIVEFIISLTSSRLYKHLPAILRELASHYRVSHKISTAIVDILPYIPKSLRSIFTLFANLLSSDSTFDEGLRYIQETLDDPFIRTLCTILQLGHTQDGDVSDHLDTLAMQCQLHYISQSESKMALIPYKAIALGVLPTIPCAMKVTEAFTDTAAGYFFTLDGSKLLLATAIVSAIGYWIVALLNKSN